MRRKGQYQYKDDADEFWWNQLTPEAQAYAIYTGIEEDVSAMETIQAQNIGGAIEVSSQSGETFIVYGGLELNDWIEDTVQGALAGGFLSASEMDAVSQTSDVEQIMNVIGTPAGDTLDGSVEVVQEVFYFFK